jgi:hypothetical protein
MIYTAQIVYEKILLLIPFRCTTFMQAYHRINMELDIHKVYLSSMCTAVLIG